MKTFVLIGCAKKKRAEAAEARDLYTSTLFRRARAYAESRGDAWRILSAHHGLLDPRAVIEPYDVTLKSFTRAEREQWARGRVVPQLFAVAPAGTRIVIVAGRDYYEHLEGELTRRGYRVEIPTRGLGLFEMIRYLGEDAVAADVDLLEGRL